MENVITKKNEENFSIPEIANFRKSGEIAHKAREYGKTLCVAGAKHLEIAEAVEAKIVELGGKPAFPCDVSVNHVAAHDAPVFNDERRLKEGDVVKLDLGAHVDGAVTDTACTVEVGTSKYSNLIEASEKALEEAIKLVKDRRKVCEIGRKIHEVITSHGFSPIKNLSGHEVGEYDVHSGLTIPNFDNGNENVLKEGMTIAIEPFATDGEGMVIEGKPAQVYGVINPKRVRDNFAREVLNYILEEYKELPFCSRWLIKKFGMRAKLALLSLEREGVVKQYKQLPEKSKGQVSQTEHTMIVKKDSAEVLT